MAKPKPALRMELRFCVFRYRSHHRKRGCRIPPQHLSRLDPPCTLLSSRCATFNSSYFSLSFASLFLSPPPSTSNNSEISATFVHAHKTVSPRTLSSVVPPTNVFAATNRADKLPLRNVLALFVPVIQPICRLLLPFTQPTVPVTKRPLLPLHPR